jgi:hypothetical protein
MTTPLELLVDRGIDCLLLILSFADSEPSAAISLSITSHAFSKQLKEHLGFWKTAVRRKSCSLCLWESHHHRLATTNPQYWIDACKIFYNTAALRRQYRLIATARQYEIQTTSDDIYYDFFGRPKSLQRPRLASEEPRRYFTSVVSVGKKIFAALTGKWGQKEITPERLMYAVPWDSESSCGLMRFSKCDRRVLSKFFRDEGSLLLAEKKCNLHCHSKSLCLSAASNINVFGAFHLCNQIEHEFEVRRPWFRSSPWEEVCVTPEDNPNELRVLQPFLGDLSGKKSDARCLILNMFYACGGGSINSGAVRWFVCSIWSSLEAKRRRSILIAICYSTHENDGKIQRSARVVASTHQNYTISHEWDVIS